MKDPKQRPSAREVLRNRFIKAHMEVWWCDCGSSVCVCVSVLEWGEHVTVPSTHLQDLSKKMALKLQSSPTRDATQEAEAIAQAV